VAKIFTTFISAVLQYCNVLREVKPKLELIANVEDELIQVISFCETSSRFKSETFNNSLHSRKKSEQLLESIKQIEEKLSNLLAQKMRMEEQVQAASKESDEIQTHLQKMTALFSSLKKEEERCAVCNS
jgi:chromosome segregation ATPase